MTDALVTGKLLTLLQIGVTFSIILMALIQKIKKLSFIKQHWHVWLINLVLSFVLGYYFSIYFYNLTIYDSIWVSIFGFIGAPSIYQILKKQNIINYTPEALNSNGDYIEVPKENEIRR